MTTWVSIWGRDARHNAARLYNWICPNNRLSFMARSRVWRRFLGDFDQAMPGVVSVKMAMRYVVWGAPSREKSHFVVVEDTVRAIEQALEDFQRFYSARPQEHFANNSGLGSRFQIKIRRRMVVSSGPKIFDPYRCRYHLRPSWSSLVVGLPDLNPCHDD